MIDQRLRSKNFYLMDLDQKVESAKQVENTKWFAVARDSLVSYFSNRLVSGQNLGIDVSEQFRMLPRTELPGTILAAVQTSNGWPATLADEVDQALSLSQSQNSERADWLLGHSLAFAVVANSDPFLILGIAVDLASQSGIRYVAFISALKHAIISGTASVLLAIERLVAEIAANPNCCVMKSERTTLRRLTNEWSKESDAVEVWSSSLWRNINIYCERFIVLEALRDCDSANFACLCEQLRLPTLIHSVLDTPAISMDFAAILELISVAPTTVADNDKTWNRNVVAPLLIEVAFDHLQKLGDAPHGQETVPNEEEIQQLVNQLAQAVLARPDGAFLLIHWARHLMWMMRSRDDSFLDLIFSETLKVMASKPVSVYDFEQFFPGTFTNVSHNQPSVSQSSITGRGSNKKINKVEFELFMLALLMCPNLTNPIPGTDAISLHALFRHHLRSNTAALADFYNDKLPNWRHYNPARLYLQEAESAKAWQADWDILAEQRRLTSQWAYSDVKAAEPSLFLASVGLAVLEWKMSPEYEDRQGGATLWDVIFLAILPLAIHWGLQQDQWRALLTKLFARYPHIHSQSDVLTSSVQNVWHYLDLLGGDDDLLLGAVANLASNGIPVSQIEHEKGDRLGIFPRAQRYIEHQKESPSASMQSKLLQFWNKELKSLGVSRTKT